MEKEIHYAGKICELVETFDENKDQKWSDIAQARIDNARKHGIDACCIHEGNLHGYYEEKVKP